MLRTMVKLTGAKGTQFMLAPVDGDREFVGVNPQGVLLLSESFSGLTLWVGGAPQRVALVRYSEGARRVGGVVHELVSRVTLVAEWDTEDLISRHGAGMQLSHVDLRGLNLEGADLERANLQGADLTGVCLYGAYAPHANFRGASLREADLEDAILEDATFWGADLTRARLYCAYAPYANFNGARFRGANLEKANLSSTDLEEASFGGAVLADARLTDASLSGADLTDEQLADTYGEQVRRAAQSLRW